MREHPNPFDADTLVSSILSRLFTVISHSRYIPAGFKVSNIVSIPKLKDARAKALTRNDYRGIAISPVISKLFEHCFMDTLQLFLTTESDQFGFKKGNGCSHAVYTVQQNINRNVTNGCTVNLCTIDLSKAVDKVNHDALLD